MGGVPEGPALMPEEPAASTVAPEPAADTAVVIKPIAPVPKELQTTTRVKGIRMRGLGRGGMRHRKAGSGYLTRDKYTSCFKTPHVIKLRRRGGIGRGTANLSSLAKCVAAGITEDIVRLGITLMEYERMQTLKPRHVRHAAKLYGTPLYY